MGRDCHRVDGGGDGGGGVMSSSSSKSKRKANGCMAAFHHLFDFQLFYFASHRNLTIDSPSRSKGLKLIEESPPSTTYKDMNIPVSMRVKTESGTTSSKFRTLATDTFTPSCNSPGCKTPNVVARLMGLDLLPERTELALSSLQTMTYHGSYSHALYNKDTRLGTRSLPESPRISSTRKSDFDIHRLSLQLNKENTKHQEFRCSQLKVMKQEHGENQTPRDYGRQIVKQIKERVVSRRVVGMDITNSVKNREAGGNSNEFRRDTTISCSPISRSKDKENKPITIQKTKSSSSFRPEQNKEKPKSTKVILVSVSKASGEKQRVKQRPIKQCNKSESETRFTLPPGKPSQTPDIRNNPQKAFLSEAREAQAKPVNKKRPKNIPKPDNDSDNISATETLQRQINQTQRPKPNESPSSVAVEGIVREYITRIMKLAGINNIDAPVSSLTIVDPSIFRELEHSVEYQWGSLALRCNRRMLFDLVNETLTESAKRRRDYHCSELLGELFSAVERYRHSRCSLSGDIASAEASRLRETKKLQEEGEEEIIAEIERDIIDTLVRETTSDLVKVSRYW